MTHTKPPYDERETSHPPHERQRKNKDEPSDKKDLEEQIHYNGPSREPGGYSDLQREGIDNSNDDNADAHVHGGDHADAGKSDPADRSKSHSGSSDSSAITSDTK